jgi:uncharacterized protein (TIGR03086 family)
MGSGTVATAGPVAPRRPHVLDLAVDAFGRRLAQVRDDQWSTATPCEGWDVRYLAAHVVGGSRFAVLVLDGAAADEAIEVVMGQRQLGACPLDDFTTSAAAQRQRFAVPGRFDRPVSHPLGEMTAGRFLELRTFDLTLHAWDLARAIGVDEELDPALVGAVLGIVEAGPMGFGIIPRQLAGRGGPPLERLLALSGR